MLKPITYKKLFYFTLLGFLLFPILHHGQVKVTRSESLFSAGPEVEIEVNKSNPCQQIQVESSATTFKFSYNSAIPDEKCRPAPKCPTLQSLNLQSNRQFEIRDGSILLGYATEIYPNSRIFVTARHVVQSLGDEYKLNELLTGLNFDDTKIVEIYEVENPTLNSKYDIIFFNFSDSTLPLWQFEKTLVDLLPQRIAHNETFSAWISKQGAQYKEASNLQVSCGEVQENIYVRGSNKKDLLLEKSSKNRSAPASSGSLVFQYDPKHLQNRPVPLGIITCQQDLTLLDPKLYSQSSRKSEIRTRVLSFERIFSDFIIHKINSKAAVDSRLTLEHFEGCRRIDGRGAGSL